MLGDDETVSAECIAYKSRADMVYDAVVRNSTHGRKLDEKDRQRSLHMLENHHWSEDKICMALKITPEKITKYRVRVATTKLPTVHHIPGTLNVSLKPSCSHLSGKNLTKKQTKAHESAPGTSYRMLVSQLLSGLRGDLLNLNDENLVAALIELADELERLRATV